MLSRLLIIQEAECPSGHHVGKCREGLVCYVTFWPRLVSLLDGTACGAGSTAFVQVSLRSTIKNTIQLFFVLQTLTLCSSLLLLSMLLFHPIENQEVTTVSVVGNSTAEASPPLSLMQKCFLFWSLLCGFPKHTYMANVFVIKMI